MTQTADSGMRRDITLTRLLVAPRALVWRAWTDPAHVARWWGPKHFTNPVCQMDVRPGGALRIVMRSPTGTEHPMIGVFQEVVPQERLVFTNIAVDNDGNTLLDGMTTVTFEEQDGRTLLTVVTGAAGMVEMAAEMLAGMQEGWSQSLDRLADLLMQRETNR